MNKIINKVENDLHSKRFYLGYYLNNSLEILCSAQLYFIQNCIVFGDDCLKISSYINEVLFSLVNNTSNENIKFSIFNVKSNVYEKLVQINNSYIDYLGSSENTTIIDYLKVIDDRKKLLMTNKCNDFEEYRKLMATTNNVSNYPDIIIVIDDISGLSKSDIDFVSAKIKDSFRYGVYFIIAVSNIDFFEPETINSFSTKICFHTNEENIKKLFGLKHINIEINKNNMLVKTNFSDLENHIFKMNGPYPFITSKR